MLPPNASGTSDVRTSRRAGATPTVPSMGLAGRLTSKLLPCAENPTVSRRRIVFVDPGPLGQRRLQRRADGNAGEPAEERDQGRRAPAPRRREVHQVYRQGVSGLGALDPERAGLRIEVLGVQRRAGHVVSAGDPAAVGVLGPQRQHRRRTDAHHGWSAPEGVTELVGRRDERDLVHDRYPARLGHQLAAARPNRSDGGLRSSTLLSCLRKLLPWAG